MSDSEQAKAFVIALNAVVARFREEFDLSVPAAIGGLEMVKLGIFQDDVVDSTEE